MATGFKVTGVKNRDKTETIKNLEQLTLAQLKEKHLKVVGKIAEAYERRLPQVMLRIIIDRLYREKNQIESQIKMYEEGNI